MQNFFLDEEFQVATKMKGTRKKKSLNDIPFYDKKGFWFYFHWFVCLGWKFGRKTHYF